MLFFTADEHYGHAHIIHLCGRPFRTVEEMDEELIRRHNAVVKDSDLVVHVGDFTLKNKSRAKSYISRLKGEHVFLRGSHDRWLKEAHEIWEKEIAGEYVVVCHYAMRVWPRSHYNSWQLYGHSHGRLDPIGKQWDIGVDNNDYYPVSFERIKDIMAERPDNPNLIKGGKPRTRR
ncbi:MAG: metallophosphoesterase [Planctomycetes bacterium]|nr:metallophosphoesterase [Planctomycetota bacterium]